MRFAAALAALFSVNLALAPVVDVVRPLGGDPARTTGNASMAAAADAKRDGGKQDGHDRDRRREDRKRAGGGTPSAKTKVHELPSGDVRQPAARMAAAAQGERFIVVLRDEDLDSQAVLDDLMAQTPGIVPTHVYSYLLAGFAAYLTPEAKQAIERDPRVASVEPDVELELVDPLPTRGADRARRIAPRSLDSAQTIPPGIARVGATRNATAKIDGTENLVNADIAIIDSGVDRYHPDLNFFAHFDCSGSNAPIDRFDASGHGTHVAGIAAAKDNGLGVVGVAPGARIWAFRVPDANGQYFASYYLNCLGVAAEYASTKSVDGQQIDVANISLRWPADGEAGGCGSSTHHQAICNAVAAGLTVVVSAGNQSLDAYSQTPAAFDEVITVSSLADNDGKPGGLGGQFPRACGNGQWQDDGFSWFSNWGAQVDIAAPGSDVLSTFPTYMTPECSTTNGYDVLSGTSMSTPHVTGAAALIKAQRQALTPAQVKAELLATLHDIPLPGDTDGIDEGVLYVGPKDTTRPSVSIPTVGSGTGNGVTVNASDSGSGINRVELGYCLAPKKPKKKKKGKKPKTPKPCEWYQATKIGEDTVAPYEFVWDPLPPPGSYLLLAWALDGSGNGQVVRVPVTVEALQSTSRRSLSIGDGVARGESEAGTDGDPRSPAATPSPASPPGGAGADQERSKESRR